MIHTAYCERNVAKCEQCGKPIEKLKLTEHVKEEHTTFPCALCNAQVLSKDYEAHKVVCVGRSIKCKFCQLSYPFRSSEEHVVACGSRTDDCEMCGQKVKLSSLETHLQECAKSFRARKKQPQEIVHEEEVQRRAKSGGRRVEAAEEEYKPKVITQTQPSGFYLCSFCRQQVRIAEEQAHQRICSGKSEDSRRRTNNTRNETEDSRNKNYDRPFQARPTDRLDAVDSRNPYFRNQNSDKDSLVCGICRSSISKRFYKEHVQTCGYSKPCQSCGVIDPDPKHDQNCRMKRVKCFNCGMAMFKMDLYKHKKYCDAPRQEPPARNLIPPEETQKTARGGYQSRKFKFGKQNAEQNADWVQYQGGLEDEEAFQKAITESLATK